MADNGQSLYTVDRLAKVADQIRQLGQRAAALGITAELVGALRAIVHKLETKPHTWGEPRHHTQLVGGLVREAIQAPLRVHYVVYEVQRAVLILNLRPLPSHPLASGGEP
jgi:hypothetical protein